MENLIMEKIKNIEKLSIFTMDDTFLPRTYKGKGWLPPTHSSCPPSPKVFLIFFLDDKTSAPEVFCSCSFIPREF